MHTTLVTGTLVFALVSATGLARGADAPRVSGSYEVIQKTASGTQALVLVKLHLVNHGPGDLRVERLTLSDFVHAGKGASRPARIVVGAQGSADTTQAFTLPREEFELWKRGSRPRLILELQPVHGKRATEVVRLERVSREREN